VNRREFLKTAGVTTAVSGVALASTSKPSFALELGKKHDTFPNKVVENVRRFSQQDHVFLRTLGEKGPTDEFIEERFGYKSMAEVGLTFVAQHEGLKYGRNFGKVGFRQVDKALELSSWSVNDHFAPNSQLGVRNSLVQTHPVNPVTGEKMKDNPVFIPGLFSWDNSKVEHKHGMSKDQYKFKDAKEAAQYVKKAGKHLGADLVGIAPYNESTKRWTYEDWAIPNVRPFTMPDGTVQYLPFDPFKFEQGEYETFGVSHVKSDFKKEAGFEPKSVIVLAFEMDYDALKSAPSLASCSTVGQGYSQMAETGHKVAEFLRNIGYKAAPCGNDTSLSVPLAIEAGLGEASRMGLLVTEKYGPRIRLAKVYTDLEIEPDKPITFGVKEFCDVCMKCADACPGEAICHEPAQIIEEGMEFDTGKVTKSTMTGVEKWFVNGERCLAFWAYNGADCGTCISVCPYNKIDEWHHDLAKLMTLTPFKPLLRDLDEIFGYGGPVEPEVRIESKYLKDAVHDFWAKI